MALEDEGIFNFRRLSPTLTTSGQPSEAQFAAIRDAGIGTIINLALTDSPRALPDQPGTLTALGLRYIHIPVDFANPTESDFKCFQDALGEIGDAPVHIHCAANYRVSAFLYRYRRLVLGWAEGKARPDLSAVWTPDLVWETFLAQG